jgi:hypothetical protein
MARKLGSKDKVKRKSRNILGTVAKVGAGLVGAGLVGGTIYTGARIGAIGKGLQRSNVAGYEAFKNSPKFVKIAYGKLSDLNENIAKTIANDPSSPMQGQGKTILDNARRSKIKLRKGFLESTKLDQKINAQKAAIAHTKTGDLANQSDEFKKSIVDRQRNARKKTRAEGDLTRRMQDEVGQYFQTTSTSKGSRSRVNPMILRPGYTTTPRLGRRKKFLGLFNNLSLSNMFILSDVNQSNYARRLGSKDKKKRKRPGIRRGMLTGAKWGAGIGAGITGLSIASALASRNGRQAMRTALEAQGRNPSLRKNAGILAAGTGLIVGANALSGGLQGGLIGGGVNAIRKYQYDRDNAR